MIRETIEQAIRAALEELGAPEVSFAVERPGDMAHGDYATNVALVAAKKLGKNPREVAEAIREKLSRAANHSSEKSSDLLPAEGQTFLQNGSLRFVDKVEIAGPGFINFYLTDKAVNAAIEESITAGLAWGSAARLKERWLIEHTSPNPNKAMHIGHLRNNITGMAIANIAAVSGVEVIRDCIDNNRGIAIAKLMWGYLKFARRDGATDKDVAYWFAHQDEWNNPQTLGMRPDRFVDQLYVQGSEDYEHHTESASTVRAMVVAWETGDSVVRALWQTVLDYSYAGQAMTLERLGNRWDHVWHEHEHYQDGKDLVEAGLQKGIFKKADNGVAVTDLAAFNLPDTVLMKSDGTSLYITQDLALTRLKREKFHPDRLFWVIGPEQSLALKQLFACCEQLGIGHFDDYTHISYGYMSLKGEGKMSSRKGTVIYIDDVLDAVKDEVRTILSAREVSLRDPEQVAEQVAIGAVKFGILKAGRTTDIAFDAAAAVDLRGDTGPYLQYTCVRARSVLARAHTEGIDPSLDTSAVAVPLGHVLRQYPEVVSLAFVELEPSRIASYLLELAAAFNSWYAQVHIMDGTSAAAHKLALTQATAQTIENGLALLGIPVPEEM